MKSLKAFWQRGKLSKTIVIVVVFVILSIIGTIIMPQTVKVEYGFSSDENLTIKLSTHNDSKAVDEVTRMAIDDLDEDSLDERNEVINDGLYYIRENLDDLTADNETMEKVMYYGNYIYRFIEENSGTSNVSELTDTERAVYEIGYYAQEYVKYPYRGVEGTRTNNVEIIEDALAQLQ